jgi:hypothetical protein
MKLWNKKKFRYGIPAHFEHSFNTKVVLCPLDLDHVNALSPHLAFDKARISSYCTTNVVFLEINQSSVRTVISFSVFGVL